MMNGGEEESGRLAGQIIGKLNSYNRATKQGRESAVNLCVYTQGRRVTINEGKGRA